MISFDRGNRAWRQLASLEFLWIGFGALCLAGALSVAAQQQPSPGAPKPLPDPNANFPLPDGPGKELVQKDCKDCHTYDRIVHAHYSTKGWRAEIKKMRANGADIRTDEIDPLVLYLTKHFGPAHPRTGPAAPPKPTSAASGGN
ncbi:MAG: hypothetical protein ACLP1Y_16780 [Candidatus Acidiferrales bacterium]